MKPFACQSGSKDKGYHKLMIQCRFISSQLESWLNAHSQMCSEGAGRAIVQYLLQLAPLI
jgi:hypothetical protein